MKSMYVSCDPNSVSNQSIDLILNNNNNNKATLPFWWHLDNSKLENNWQNKIFKTFKIVKIGNFNIVFYPLTVHGVSNSLPTVPSVSDS